MTNLKHPWQSRFLTCYLQREVWEVTEMRKLSYRKFGKLCSVHPVVPVVWTYSISWNILKLPKHFFTPKKWCVSWQDHPDRSTGNIGITLWINMNQSNSLTLLQPAITSPKKNMNIHQYPLIIINHECWCFTRALSINIHVAWAISGTKGSLGLGSVNKDEIDSRTFEIVSAGLHWSWTTDPEKRTGRRLAF